MIEWFETHAHLSDAKFDTDRDEVLNRAFEGGVSKIIEIADGPDEWEKARTLAERYPGKMWWAAGLHPYYADQGSDDIFSRLKSITSHSQFVGIGEVGLDYAKCPIAPDVQKQTLIRALHLAEEVRKPLIIHCRDAYADLIPLFQSQLKKNPPLCPGVIHCFSGNAEEAKALVEFGFYLGVDAPITYPSAKGLREAIQSVAPQHLVIETDSPYLPPQSHRGQRNEPSYLPATGEKLASIFSISVDELATILRQNSNTLFRLN